MVSIISGGGAQALPGIELGAFLFWPRDPKGEGKKADRRARTQRSAQEFLWRRFPWRTQLHLPLPQRQEVVAMETDCHDQPIPSCCFSSSWGLELITPSLDSRRPLPSH